MTSILFITHADKQCGIYQYGLRFFRALEKIPLFNSHYAECKSAQDFLSAVELFKPDIIIYNYYPTTLPFLTPKLFRSLKKCIHIAVMHEMDQKLADAVSGSEFHYYLYGDPTLKTTPFVFRMGRLLPSYKSSKEACSDKRIRIGSYGFGFPSKGFPRLIKQVQREFDTALIRLHIPRNPIVDPKDKLRTAVINRCKKMVQKSEFSLEISEDFLSEEALLNFLASNDLNVFLYKDRKKRCSGIASAPDFALAVDKPIAISHCPMFRHLVSLSPSIVIPISAPTRLLRSFINHPWMKRLQKREFNYSSLQAVIEQGTTHLKHLQREWGEEEFIANLQRSLSEIHAQEKRRSFNAILDNRMREEYSWEIEQLHRLAPETIKRKIPRANIQQAFVMATVKRLACPEDKLLCVGSYEDTACEALMKLGYNIECVDPVLNYDLDTFFHKNSTKKASYDLIFSTSVVEHVKEDEKFFQQIASLLALKGVGVFTCDFKGDYRKGDFVFPGNFRFYTDADLKNRILPLLNQCHLFDHTQWDEGAADFNYENVNYCFATLVFQKTESVSTTES